MAVKEKDVTIDFSKVCDEDKFKELVLYVASKCSDDPDFGATKLNKILFYSEMYAYGEWGKSITRMPYFALRRGPAPKYLAPIQREMEEDHEIAIQTRPRFQYEQKRIIPLRQPNLDKFSAKEIALVDEVIEDLCGANADLVSQYSHLEVGWQVAEYKEDIPYETVFLSNKPLNPDDIKHGLKLAKKHGWAI